MWPSWYPRSIGTAILKASVFRAIQTITVTAPKFFEGLQALITSTKPAVWQSYFQWQIVRDTASLLSKPFVDERFRMQQALTGQPELPSRWRRCVSATDDSLGDLLAQPYVKDHFPGDSKQSAETVVSAISAAMASDLGALDWMDADTRTRAREKLGSLAYLIGYPEKWKAYDFPVDAKTYAQNVLRSRNYELKRALGKVGKPVDRTEWQMTAPTVNAYYDPQRNQMVFPARYPAAAVLRPSSRPARERRGDRHGRRPRTHARLRR